MGIFSNMHPASIIVICVILALFVLSLVMLFGVCAVYRRQRKCASLGDTNRSHLMHDAYDDFSAAYRVFGQETNTPAIISGAIRNHLGFALFCERYLNNAVSLFVTLGLLGTFLGLSMSVGSLTELLSFGSGTDWQLVLNNVGEGLLSALSGMGVAFYTSLVGVACSILLTILRAIWNPESVRIGMENEMELWLDHRAAPRLDTERVSDESELVMRMVSGMNTAASIMEKGMNESSEALKQTMETFNNTIRSFNGSIHDFSEFEYQLRTTAEKLDLAVKDLTDAIRRVSRSNEGGSH